MNEHGLEYNGMALEIAQICSGVCTFLLLISIYIRYVLWFSWAKTVNKYTKYDGFVNTGLWKEIVVELIINAVSPMPFLNGIKYTEYVLAFDTTIQYEVNDILLFFAFMRLYLTIKFLLYLS